MEIIQSEFAQASFETFEMVLISMIAAAVLVTIPSTSPIHGSSDLSRKTISSEKPPLFGSPKKKKQGCLTDIDGGVSSEQ